MGKDKRHIVKLCFGRHKLRKMLLPDPANQFCRVILILCKPQLAFCANDVEDLGLVSISLQDGCDQYVPRQEHRIGRDILPRFGLA